MGPKKTKTTSNETATTTPNLNPNAAPVVDNYFSSVGNMQNSEWLPYVAPNAILNNVFANAGNLTPGNDWITSGIQGTTQAIGSIPGIYDRTLNRAQLGDASLAQAPTMGRATLGDPTKVDLSSVGGYSATNAGQGLLASGGAAVGGRASTYMQDYINPYTEQVVNTSLNDYDINAGKQQADYTAQAAKRGAFGGSRQALGETALMGEIARGRAATDANIRAQMWRDAMEAGAGDATNETNASIATAGNATQASVANANNDAQRMMFNAGEQNKFGLQGQRIAGDAAIENARIARDYGLGAFQEAGLNNRAEYAGLADINKTNAGFINDYGIEQYRGDNSANQLQYKTQSEQDANRANLQMDYYGQRLDQANQLGQLGGLLNTGAYNGMNQQIDIGKALQDILEDQNMAPAEKMAIINNLIAGGGLLGTTTGQTINSNGTSTSKESGGLVGSILGSLAGGFGTALGGKIKF